MKTTKKVPAGAAVLAMAAVTSLTQKQRIETFVDLSKSAQRAFSGMGKLMFAISSNLKADETIYAVMRKAGVKDGTTSNASYASRVWELVQDGILTEAEYDTFTFQDIFAICRVTGAKSAKRLDAADVAVIIRNVPDFEVELKCLYTNGVTTEEKVENERMLREAQEQQDAEDAAKKILDSKPAAAPAAAPGTTPGGSKPASETPAPAPAANSVAPAAEPPTNVVPMPRSKPTGEEALRLLDSVEEMMLELDADAQELVARRVIAMAETICAFIEKPTAKKSKKAAVAA